MKKFHLVIFILLANALYGYSQSYHAYGLDKVHLADTDKTVIAGINPEKSTFKPKSNLYYSWYLANAIHVTEGGYDGKLLNGVCTEYYLNHSLKTQGNYSNGLKNGIFKEWLSNGALINYITWNNGVKDGEYRLYDSKGHLTEQGYYDNGLQNGRISYFSGTDSVRVVLYHHGHPVTRQRSTLWQKINIFKKHQKYAG